MCETKDNLIGDYWSIYTTKQMPIQVAQETDVEQLWLVEDVNSFFRMFSQFDITLR